MKLHRLLPLIIGASFVAGIASADVPPGFILKWGSPGTGDGFFSFPRSIALDPTETTVYVADAGNNRIQRFNTAGGFLTKWGSFGATDGKFNFPAGVAVNAAGEVYVADTDNNRVQKFTATGTFILKWGSAGSADGKFLGPDGIDVDVAGNVYVVDRDNHRVQVFSGTGTFLAKWGTFGTGPGEFDSPSGITVAPDGSVYVADAGNHRIQHFTAAGLFLAQWGGFGSSDGQLIHPDGVDADNAGNVYVADFNNNRVQKFDGAGNFILKFGVFGVLDGQFNGPYDAAVDALGNVFVTDANNRRIQKFGPSFVQPATPTACINLANPCLTLPVRVTRTDNLNLRAFSVSLQLSPSLALCPGPGISEGTYLSAIGATDFHVLNNGGGSYTVDGAILGLPCGQTAASGTLFNLPLTHTGVNGTGTVTITQVIFRDCDNGPLPGIPGSPVTATIDITAPTAATLAAAQKKTGNTQPPNGTTDITLSWTGQESGASIAIYRKGFGGYPQYDENGGAVPAVPATPAAAVAAGWTLSTVTTSGGNDRASARDFYYFVAFVTDACGNVSPASNMTPGTLNYHLGDAHNGTTACQGNDVVNTADVSFLGLNYGALPPLNDALECLDIGPTTNNSVNARPTTDNRLQFEDLILLAINYGQVSAPQAKALPAPAAANTLRLGVPALPAPGETFAVALELEAAGDIQGLSAELDYDATVVEPVGVEAGALLASQAAPSMALSSHPGNVDVALLGTGYGLRGTGEVARVLFRVKGAGSPNVRLREALARDATNRPVMLSGTAGLSSLPLPAVTALSWAAPNPFRTSATLEYSLASGGPVELAIYSVDGRRIRSLLREERAPGVYRVVWDGNDDRGNPVAAGVFYVRLVTPSVRATRTIIRLP